MMRNTLDEKRNCQNNKCGGGGGATRNDHVPHYDRWVITKVLGFKVSAVSLPKAIGTEVGGTRSEC